MKSKGGPAVMDFGGNVEVQGLDAATRKLQRVGKGADESASSASMQLTASLEEGEAPGSVMLVGVATVSVSGKLAQFGSRLLVPVSDALLAQFADNFRAAAVAVAVPVAPGAEAVKPAAASEDIGDAAPNRRKRAAGACAAGPGEGTQRPNVRAKLAPTVWRAGRHAQNGPQAQRMMASATSRWRSA